MPYNVFISYSTKDLALVQHVAIAETLRTNAATG